MLTKEEREKIRLLCTRFDKRPSINATLEMLDMIDKLEAALIEVKVENLKWNDVDCNTCLINTLEECDEICASKGLLINELVFIRKDRDRWMARAEALERALNHADCNNPECNWYRPCDTCKGDADFCDHLCNGDGDSYIDLRTPCPHWEFDEARFAEGKEYA